MNNSMNNTIYSMTGEKLGKIFGKVSCQRDGSILLCDILYEMTKLNPVLKAKDIAELYLCMCPENYTRQMVPKYDEFVRCSVYGVTTQMKNTPEFADILKVFDAGEKAILSTEFIEDYLGVDLNEESEILSSVEFVLYEQEADTGKKIYMTLYDVHMMEEQRLLETIISGEVKDKKGLQVADKWHSDRQVLFNTGHNGTEILVEEVLDVDNVCIKDEVTRSYIDAIIGTLQKIEQDVIYLRFGIEDGRCRTLQETADELGILIVDKILSIETNALRKLKHHSRSKMIKSLIITEADTVRVV